VSALKGGKVTGLVSFSPKKGEKDATDSRLCEKINYELGATSNFWPWSVSCLGSKS